MIGKKILIPLLIVLLLIPTLRNIALLETESVSLTRHVDILSKSHSYPIINIEPEGKNIVISNKYFGKQVQIDNLTLNISLENTTFFPGIIRNLTITIENNSTSEEGPFGLYVRTPYFLIASEYMVLSNSTGNYTVPFEYVTVNPIGNVSPGDTLTVYLPLEGIYGVEEKGVLSVVIYRGDESLSSADIEITMIPMFSIDAYLEEKVLNISAKNYTTIHVTIKNIFPKAEDICYIRNISINISSVPPSEIEPEHVVVLEINNTAPPTNLTFRIEVDQVGAYEILIYARAASAYLVNADKYIEFPGELAVRKILITTTQKLIIFDEGHEQYYRFASGYMQGVIGIASEFGPVLINHGEFKAEILNSEITALIIIPNPQPPSEGQDIFTDDEVSLLQSFLESGGSIILMGNWYQYFWPSAKQNGYDAITGKYGVYWIDGDVYDNTSNFGRIYDVRITNFANNTIARLMTSGVGYVRFSGTALNLTESKASIPIEIYPILLGDNDTFVTLGAATEPHVVNGTDVIMAVAAIINGSGRLFACGSSYMFSDYYYFGDNTVFIENLFYWLFSAKKLDLVISTKPYVYVGETHKVTVKITNRGVIAISDIVLVIAPQEDLTYLNQTTTFVKDLLEPGESWTICLAFKANKPGDFYVRFILSASDYPEEISRTVFLRFKAGGIPLTYVALGVIVVIVVAGVLIFRWKRRATK